MRMLVTLLLVLLTPSLVHAQVVKLVRQDCGLLGCSQSTGTGVIIGAFPESDGGYTYHILTAHHLCGPLNVRHLFRAGGDCKVSMISKVAGRYPTRIVCLDGQAMLMVLECRVPAGIPKLPACEVAERVPQAGESVNIHGFSYVRDCQYGVRSITLRMVSDTIFQTNSPFEQGESGGPILDSSGEIVGIADGYYVDQKNVGYGPSVVAIRRFLRLGPRSRGQRHNGSEQQVPVLTRVQVSPPPEIGDAEKYTPPVHQPGPVVPAPLPSDEPRKPDNREQRRTELPPTKEEVPPIATPRIPEIPKSREPDRPAPEQRTEPAPTASNKLWRAGVFGMDLLSVLAGAGLIGGTGGIGWFVLAALKWRRAAKAASVVVPAVTHVFHQQQPSVTPVPVTQVVQQQPQIAVVATESPPLPQQVINTASFIPYETNLHQQAYEWAKENIGKRWPGTAETFPALDSLIGQYISSRTKGK